MDAQPPPLEDLLYRRLGQLFDQLGTQPVPGLYQVLQEQLDRAVLRQALERTGGQVSAAAELLGLDRNTVSRKVRRLKLERGGRA